MHSMSQVDERKGETSSRARKRGVRWEAQAERSWLASLLANEKAVAPLVSFLKATEVGWREGARERVRIRAGKKSSMWVFA